MSSANVLAPAENLAPLVVIVDADFKLRQSLQNLITSAGYVVETFATANEFLARQLPHVPSCLILDLEPPDVNGLDVHRCVVENGRVLPVIFTTNGTDVCSAVRAMKAGAVELLTKPLAEDILLTAIEEAITHSRRALAEEARINPLRSRYAMLTPRERELMAWVVRGLPNKRIGAQLGISEITVKEHRGRVMRKLQARSLAELVIMAELLESTSVSRPSASPDRVGPRSLPAPAVMSRAFFASRVRDGLSR